MSNSINIDLPVYYYHDHQGQSKSSDDLLELSDAFEFQENEILNAKDKLRSIRAKIAVIEGKMALTIMYGKLVLCIVFCFNHGSINDFESFQ